MTDGVDHPTGRQVPWRGRRRVADPKDTFITVRCTSEDRALIEEQATIAGLSVGAYLRSLALGAPGPRAVRRPPVERADWQKFSRTSASWAATSTRSPKPSIPRAICPAGPNSPRSKTRFCVYAKPCFRRSAVIIKGNSCAGARRLAFHIQRTDTNERVEIIEMRGLAADDLKGALLEMEAVTAGSRCTKPFYHATINPTHQLTPDQRDYAIQQLADKLGLGDQPRVVVAHIKAGREHYHIVFGRYDTERMRTISDSHNYRKHEEVARHLEREFGHERVQGAHAERDGAPRPERTPSHAEMLQADRTGLTPKQVKEQVTEIWRRTDNGGAFTIGLWDASYTLCRGDRRDFVVIDPLGGTHSLARCIEGARTKDIRARMSDVDPAHLPTVAQGRQYSADRRPIYLAQEQDRLDQENQRKTSGSDLDWSNKGGMVEQQRSALEWAKSAQEHNEARKERTDRRSETSDAMEFAKQRREALLREFGRDVDHELSPSDRERGQEQARR